MSMYTDYMDSLSEEEKTKIKNDNKSYQDKRIEDLQEKIKNKSITQKDFEDIIDRWSLVVTVNPQWTWPKENPQWVMKVCEELEMCMNKDCKKEIFDLFMDDDLSNETFYSKLNEMYLESIK